MRYEHKMEIKGALRTPVVEEVPTTFKGKKYFKRKEINEKVFDEADSIADNAKMISLMFSVVSRIWQIIPQEQKDTLEDSEVQVIDETIQKFRNTTTWADRLFAEEGTGLVDRLFARQEEIGNIMAS